MIHPGKKQTLFVDAEDSSGFYLLCSESQEVFMPGTLAPKDLKAGDKVEAFVFVNSEGDQIATGSLPLAEVGDLVCLKVKDTTPHGAYLDIGLPKDLLVPKSVQKYEMIVGDTHLVRVMLDEQTKRLFGSEKIEEFVENPSGELLPLAAVKLIPFHRTRLGYKVLIDGRYLGVVYHNEIFHDITLGTEYQGTVKSVREDGKVDALMQRTGKDASTINSEKILVVLQSSGGRLDLGDKSSPDAIRERLGISKKSFKVAVGSLYKQRLICVGRDFIELVGVGDAE